MLVNNWKHHYQFASKTSNVKRLLFACDQNSLYLQENSECKHLHETGFKPTQATTQLIEKSLRNRMRVGFLSTDEAEEECQDSRPRSFLPDEVESISISSDENIECAFGPLLREFSSDPSEVLFVAADRRLRGEAARLGCQVAAHPALAELLIESKALHFCELRGLLGTIKKLKGMVPYYLEDFEEDRATVFAALSQAALVEAAKEDIEVTRLPLDLGTQDPMFVRVDHWDDETLEIFGDATVISAQGGRVLIALSPDDANDVISLYGRHGHLWMLMPSSHLFDRVETTEDQSKFAMGAQQYKLVDTLINQNVIEIMKFPPELDLRRLLPRCEGSSYFQNNVDRYSGVLPLDSAGTISSREVRHPDNVRVVNALLADLRAMGYCAWTHSFSYGGQTAKNVIADLPGKGCLQLDPRIFRKIYHILDLYPRAVPVTPWLGRIEKLLGEAWSYQLHRKAKSPWQLRQMVEWELGMYPMPSLLLCPLAGFGAKTVIVGCHLDSTAGYDAGYDPATDAAPGADDNASGIAGTLSVAKFLSHYRGTLKHTVRFCFFNAEEVGVVGSQAYASYLKSANTAVKAAICMDMIGYNSDSHKIFEVHAGYTDPAVRDISVPIANQIAASAAQLGQLGLSQIYKGTNPNSNADRNTYDGAINRSDHASFHQQGYPAVVVSEDFFVNYSAEPAADPNPNYHRQADTVVDSSYGADIACAVAHAAKQLAT